MYVELTQCVSGIMVPTRGSIEVNGEVAALQLAVEDYAGNGHAKNPLDEHKEHDDAEHVGKPPNGGHADDLRDIYAYAGTQEEERDKDKPADEREVQAERPPPEPVHHPVRRSQALYGGRVGALVLYEPSLTVAVHDGKRAYDAHADRDCGKSGAEDFAKNAKAPQRQGNHPGHQSEHDERNRRQQVHEREKPRYLQRAREAAEGVRKPACVVVLRRLQEKPHEAEGEYRGEDVGDEQLEYEATDHPVVRLRRRKRIREALPHCIYRGHQIVAYGCDRKRIIRLDKDLVYNGRHELQQCGDAQKPPEPLSPQYAPRLAAHLAAASHLSFSVRSTVSTFSARFIAPATARTPKTSVP